MSALCEICNRPQRQYITIEVGASVAEQMSKVCLCLNPKQIKSLSFNNGL
jgi:hypothetical protein